METPDNVFQVLAPPNLSSSFLLGGNASECFGNSAFWASDIYTKPSEAEYANSTFVGLRCGQGSNLRPAVLETAALPTELPQQSPAIDDAGRAAAIENPGGG